MMQLVGGILLGALIAFLAWRVGALAPSGAWAAALTGGLIFGLGGMPWAVLLLVFFVSSSALSRAFASRKSALAEKFSKGSHRDWGQVFANGGFGTLLAVAYAIFSSQDWLWVGFVGAMAAVNADTWATELGVLSSVPPRLISTGKVVERGTSGGVSLMGTFAALGGAILVAVVAGLFSLMASVRDGSALLEHGVGATVSLLAAGVAGGMAGALFDSLLGATVQAIYRCPTCNKETERHPLHTCGSITEPLRGWRWLNNDMVNFACSMVGAVATLGCWWLLF